MLKSTIMKVELDDGGKQTGEIKNVIKNNLVELNKVWKQPQGCSGKKMFL